MVTVKIYRAIETLLWSRRDSILVRCEMMEMVCIFDTAEGAPALVSHSRRGCSAGRGSIAKMIVFGRLVLEYQVLSIVGPDLRTVLMDNGDRTAQ